MPITAPQALAALNANQHESIDFMLQKANQDKEAMLRSMVIEDSTKQTAHIRGISQESSNMVYNKARG